MVVQVIKSDYHFNFLKLEKNIKFKKMIIKKNTVKYEDLKIRRSPHTHLPLKIRKTENYIP